MVNNTINQQANSAQASIFGNYMMKVVQSVERRKKKQQLAITNGHRLSSLMAPESTKPSQMTSMAI